MSESTFDVVQAAAAELSGSDAGADVQDSGTVQEDAGTGAGEQTPEAQHSDAAGEAAGASAGDKAAASTDDESALAAIEAELVTKTPGLKKGRIPVSRHQAVLTRERRQAEEKIKALEAFKAKADDYGSESVQTALKVMKLAENHPEVFVKQVLLNDPRYRSVLEGLAKPAPVAAPAAKAEEPIGEQPKPDVLLPDGTIGYSAQQMQKLLDWRLTSEKQSSKAEREALEKRLADLDAKFKPIQEQREAQEKVGSALSQMKALLDDARTNWPGFKDHEADIRAELSKPGNGRMGLDAAYRAVVLPRLMADKTKMEADIRASILAELNKAKPTDRRTTAGAAEATVNDDDTPADSTESIVKKALRELNAA